jgi:hypothetical protein
MTAKKSINLFIDTNILLDFYRYSNDDLEKLNQLEDLIVKAEDINLIVTSQQVDEFYRNRDKVIADASKELKPAASLPELFSGHADFKDIKDRADGLRKDIERIKRDTLDGAKVGTLRADQIINRLLASAIMVDDDTYAKARRRSAVGNPPGKPGSIGDAINWEMLLKHAPDGEDIHIISRDGDYASALDGAQLDSHLQRDWQNAHLKGGVVNLHVTLNGFFKICFPGIKLMGEYVKDALVRRLQQSPSFNDSRAIIEKMLHAGTFSEKQAEAIMLASLNNDQVLSAHKYSPDLIGAKLWQIIAPHISKFDPQIAGAWYDNFSDEDEEPPEDYMQSW